MQTPSYAPGSSAGTADSRQRDIEPRGLSRAEAAKRLARYGSNDAQVAGRATALKSLASLLGNPLVVILLLAALVSGFLGDRTGAAIITAMVALSVTLNFVLHHRSERAADRLRKEIVPTATALRDGCWQELPRRVLVPGDIIRLSAGDRVPADARLLTAVDLYVQQAALTGESVPVEKRPSERPADESGDASASHLVFLGTSVVTGTGVAQVFATGKHTRFGDVADALSERPPPTEFERGMDRFARLIMYTVLFLLLSVVLSGIALHRPPMQSLLFGLALAVGLTPEFMPMITTVTLARGAVRMAHRRVIVKHLSAIEDFGSMTVLLSDKTGTLTRGDAAVVSVLDPFGVQDDQAFLPAYLNSAFQTGIHNPLDTAILDYRQLPTGDYRKIAEFPFDFERRRLGIVVRHAQEAFLAVKGAPESVLAQCTHYARHGEIVPLDASSREAVARSCVALAEQGVRTLAVAYRSMPMREHYGVADETDLVHAGFIAFSDTLLPGIGDSLRALEQDGIAIKILSGDNERVTQHVCAQVGLNVERIMLGSELDGKSEMELGVIAERCQVFARLTPSHKHRIVLALKRRNNVVGFLGDGINDAPSLHAADVGISVANAVDVAKDAADIVLRERDLSILHTGVIEGRRAFANVMKYLMMSTSSNFGNMASMAAGALFLPFLPMLPSQILLNNFLYDLTQTTIPTDHVDADQTQRPLRWDVRLIRRFMVTVGPISSLFDFLTFYVLLHGLHAPANTFRTGWFVESLATQVLVLFVIRTAHPPWRSRPSMVLATTALLVVAFGVALPWMPFAGDLGFVPLPPAFLAFLPMAVLVYLVLIEMIKRRFMTSQAGS